MKACKLFLKLSTSFCSPIKLKELFFIKTAIIELPMNLDKVGS